MRNQSIFFGQTIDYGNFGVALGDNTNFPYGAIHFYHFLLFPFPSPKSFSVVPSWPNWYPAFCYKTQILKMKIMIYNKKAWQTNYSIALIIILFQPRSSHSYFRSVLWVCLNPYWHYNFDKETILGTIRI